MIVLGADTGATTAFALVEWQDGRPTWLDSMSTRAFFVDGHRLIATPRDCFADARNLDAVCVEVSSGVQSQGKSVGAGFGIARGLIAASEQAGMLLGWAQALGVPVLRVSAHDWRKAIIGKRNASDAEIKAALPRVVIDVPERSNSHVRDAIGVATWGLRELQRRAKAAA